MRHSIGCAEILHDCDFPEDQYRFIETILVNHTPSQIKQAIKKADKGGHHADFEYFIPMFDHYIPPVIEGSTIALDDFFWEAYDYIAQFVEDDFHISDLKLIHEMSSDLELLKVAISKSKPHIRYVFKVYCNICSKPNSNVSMTVKEIDLTKKGIKTSELT